ncbi:MAG TPA: TIGR03620 family F420-dependent LLM class oxidoreductase [Acidimicrobiia bacterium]|nr:TIGR03620 family F420-dependent LLM class oxidoreductase [Acidimicrobiia bacterium]
MLSGTGIWSPHLRYGDAGMIAESVAELEQLGYRAVWIPDVGGDVMAAVEVLLAAAPTITVATGILNIWMHQPEDVAARRASWSDGWQRRFLMGLGVSHAPLIDAGEPGRYSKPYSKMVEFLDALDDGGVPVDGRVLAALRTRMLELAAQRAAGVHPYFVPPEHVARAREIIGPDHVIAVELAVVRDRDPSTARTTARRHTAIYVTLPNYTNNLREFGFDDDDFAAGGSDRLVDAIVAWGDDDAIVQREQAMRDAGADHVCVQVIRADDEVPRDDWRALAPILAG